MSFLSSLDISGSAMTAQKRRMDTIAENIANRETTRTQNGTPYRRKLTVFREIPSASNRANTTFKSEMSQFQRKVQQKNNANQNTGGVMVSQIIEDQSELIPVYDPSHPDADDQGYVMMPNVNATVEMTDAMAASRSFSANVAVFEAIKMMANQALELGK